MTPVDGSWPGNLFMVFNYLFTGLSSDRNDGIAHIFLGISDERIMNSLFTVMD